MARRSRYQKSPEERTPLEKMFPIFAAKEYESTLNRCAYQVGIDDDYPAELRERLSAAAVSYEAQLSSIDYTRKKYLQKSYEEDPLGAYRSDRRIRHSCLVRIGALRRGLAEFRGAVTADSTIGEYLCDVSFHRVGYSVQRAFAEADKGALYESLVIVRMALEQVCWAVAIRGSNDPDTIRSTSATKSITPIAKRYAKVGRLNGWLSDHAHWAYDAHIKAAFDGDGMVLFANSAFKACAYAALIMFCDLYEKIAATELGDVIDWRAVTEVLASSKEAAAYTAQHEFEAIRVMIVSIYPDIDRIG